MSFFSVVDPEGGDNIVRNPSAETTGNHSPIDATVTISTEQARQGIRAYRLAMGGTSQGLFCFMTTATQTTHYASWYAWNTTATMRATMNSGTNWNSASVIGGKTGGWVRYGVQVPPAETTASVKVGIISAQNVGTLYVDAVQVEAKSYPTTYIDGDMDGLYRWNGLRHGSSSTRDAQERSGGVERDLYDEYAITVMPSFSGVGMPGIQNNLQNLSLQPGALFQSYKILPREITLDLNINAQAGATWPTLHQKRQAFINLVKPDRARGAQPFTLVYKGADRGAGARNLYAKFIYQSGLEFGNLQSGYLDRPQVRCLAVDPAWYEDNQITQVLTMQTITTQSYAMGRINGRWQTFGSGLSAAAYSTLFDKRTNRVYFAGGFTTGNGVVLNNAGYWNGNTFVPLSTTGTNGPIYNMAQDKSGNIWMVGNFTTAGTVPTRYVARYNVSSNTFTGFATTAGGPGVWSHIAIDTNDTIYLAGGTTNWNGVTTQNYITKSSDNGSSWSIVGTSPFSTTAGYPQSLGGKQLAVDLNNNLYAGTYHGSTTAYVKKWDNVVWTTAAYTETNALGRGIYSIANMPDGNLMFTGDFNSLNGVTSPTLGVWNGTSINATTGSLSSSLISGVVLKNNVIVLGGSPNLFWNKYSFNLTDISPVAMAFYGLASNNNDIYAAGNSGITKPVSAITDVPQIGTASAFPKVIFIGPTTAGTTATLQWLENQSTEEKIFLNYTLADSEVITLDFSKNIKKATSDLYGEIYGQPQSGSDVASFHLLPTTNTLSVFVYGKATTTSGSAAILSYTPAHHSIDGSA